MSKTYTFGDLGKPTPEIVPIQFKPLSVDPVRLISLMDDAALSGCAWWFQDHTRFLRSQRNQ